MATQGVPTFQNFNTNDGVFKADIMVDASITAPNVLYLNKEHWYPHGVRVTLHVDGEALNETQVAIDFSDSRYYKFQVQDPQLNGKTINVKAIPQ